MNDRCLLLPVLLILGTILAGCSGSVETTAEGEIAKLLGENLFRVWSEVEQVAQESR